MKPGTLTHGLWVPRVTLLLLAIAVLEGIGLDATF